jgi:hypothetical protein
MSVTYAYHGGVAPDTAQECQSEGAAIRRAEGMLRDPANVGAVAFKHRRSECRRIFRRGAAEAVWRRSGGFEL